MNRFLLFSALLFTSINGIFCQTRCGVDYHVELSKQSPEIARTRQVIEDFTARWIKENQGRMTSRSVVTIPVVVHVVWNKTEENISNEQIYSQIEVLNRDFRKMNVEVPGIPSVFQNKIADVEIEFCLAGLDPLGNPAPGITRTYTDNSIGIGGTSAIHYTSQGGTDAWDTERYLNIWVAKFAGGVGGVACFPGECPVAEDGIEINYLQFGTIGLEPPYHLGRTTTHEIGHYFNLEHPWGPSITDCCEDDSVSDTPEACETYLHQCPVHPVVSCSQPDMFMDFMFYTDDSCMGMFTNGQKMRMLAALNGPRSGLLEPVACVTTAVDENSKQPQVLIYQTDGTLNVEIKSSGQETWQVILLDITGRAWIQVKLLSNSIYQQNISKLPPGIYILRLQNEGRNFVRKIAVAG